MGVLALLWILLATLLHVVAGAPLHSQEVRFYTAKWCGPCQQLKPELPKLEAQGVKVRIIDVDELERSQPGPPLPVNQVPTVHLVDAGGVVRGEWIGELPVGEISAKWRALGQVAANAAATPTQPSPSGGGQGGGRSSAMDARIIYSGGFGSGTTVSRLAGGGTAIVTNYHVVAAATGPLTVISGHGRATDGHVVATDPVNDLALVAVAETWPIASLAREAAAVGSEVNARGYARGQTFTFHTGRITAQATTSHDERNASACLVGKMDGGFDFGCSGGGVFQRGKLVGVLFATGRTDPTVLQWTPAAAVRRLVEQKRCGIEWQSSRSFSCRPAPCQVIPSQAPQTSLAPLPSRCDCRENFAQVDGRLDNHELRVQQLEAKQAKFTASVEAIAAAAAEARFDTWKSEIPTPPAVDLSGIEERIAALEQAAAATVNPPGDNPALPGKLYYQITPRRTSNSRRTE